MNLIVYLTKAVITCALLIALALAIFIGSRVLSSGQVDNAKHIAAKRAYLEQIVNLQPSLDEAPNIIFFLYDDMGYGDIGAGASDPDIIKTPHLDELARNGVVLSDFYSPSSVCTPSRAGFLTGRLAPRAGLPNVVFPSGSFKEFLGSKLMDPGGNVRLPQEEITLADVLNAAGYRTAMVGKWHLGDKSPSLPNDMGFNSFFGSLYSNDMEPFALYRDREIEIPSPADQTQLTQWYTSEAISFINADNRPFFLYFAHNFPHDPLHAQEQQLGLSDGGLYGDVLEEIDRGVGEIVDTLRSSGQLENTLIIVSSDNGPWYLGDAGNQRGRKGNTFEGGMRVPFIAHWPAVIAGGRMESAMAMGTDLLPTLLDILHLPAPTDRIIDGKSILPTLVEGSPSPHEFLYYISGETLFSVRNQRFKYRAPAGVFYGLDQIPFGFAVPQKEWLFDLTLDSRESYDTSVRYPQESTSLRVEFERMRRELGDNLRGWSEP